MRPECELCGDNEGPKSLHAKCHMTAPLQASFDNGVITLSCYIPDCRRVVARFKIERLLT